MFLEKMAWGFEKEKERSKDRTSVIIFILLGFVNNCGLILSDFHPSDRMAVVASQCISQSCILGSVK